ncbi:MAG: hypothetical protein GY822_32400 [Deltaproteobacteria bacterium]|nr:hypothetical protein [Deltaproteobacteria bacterium]
MGCPSEGVSCTENDDCVDEEVCVFFGSTGGRCVVLADEPDDSGVFLDAGDGDGGILVEIDAGIDAGPPVVEGLVFFPLLPLSGAQVLQSAESNTWGYFLVPEMSFSRLESPDGSTRMTLFPPSAL